MARAGAAGAVVSDRASLRLERGGTLDAEIAPASLYETLRRAWPGILQEARRRAVAAVRRIEQPGRSAPQQGPSRTSWRSFASTSSGRRRRTCPRLPARARHCAIRHVSGPSASGLPASALAARLEALERYYLFLEELIAPLLGQAGEQGLVALVADPGRSASTAHGLLALAGPQARAGVEVGMARDDIMPTLLYALGVPASRELPGRPRPDLLSPGFTARVPVREVDGYGRGSSRRDPLTSRRWTAR